MIACKFQLGLIGNLGAIVVFLVEEASNRDLEHVGMDQIVQEINKRKKAAINNHVRVSWL